MNYLACYKGPATGLFNITFHKVVCWWTRSKYSHCELVINGTAYSSSSRDKGVRKKEIDFSSGKWDLYPVELDEVFVLNFYERAKDDKYDYKGLLWFVIGYIPQKANRWFCSEWCGFAMKIPFAHKLSIQDLVDYLQKG